MHACLCEVVLRAHVGVYLVLHLRAQPKRRELRSIRAHVGARSGRQRACTPILVKRSGCAHQCKHNSRMHYTYTHTHTQGLERADWLTQYLVSMYWVSISECMLATILTHMERMRVRVCQAYATMSTVGYGDVVAVNDTERVYTMVAQLIGVTVYSYTMLKVSGWENAGANE